MTNNNLLKDKAITSINILVDSLQKIHLIEGHSSICETYTRVVNDNLSKFDKHPRKFNDNDIKRISFEVLCFAVFIMTRISPKFFTKKISFFKSKIDYENNHHFNSNLIEQISTYFNGNEYYLREIVISKITPKIEFSEGMLLDAYKRINDYIAESDKEEGAELKTFGKNLAKALDPQNYPVLELIGGNYATIIVNLSKAILESIFKLN